MTDLEREARDLYRIVVAAMKPDTPRYTAVGEEIAEFQFVQGYLAAAAPREQEIERLRAELAKIKLPIWMLREEHEKEVAALRSRVAELEGNAPRWARGLERNRLEKLGWLVAGGEMVWHRSPGDVEASWHCLMVPPIQLPEGE